MANGIQEIIKFVNRNSKVDNLFGGYRGRVVSIDDPDRLGRCQVRVFAIHGSESNTPNNVLPWAEVAEPGGGGYDYGSFNPPPPGSSIWVIFEGGYIDFPVIIGTSRGAPVRNADNPNVLLTVNGEPKSEKPWLPPDGELETPKEVFEDVYEGDPHPTVRVPFKSYKGHAIIVNDEDGNEYLRIVDRAGQLMEMYCPVDEEKQQGNAAQRGTRNVSRGDQLPHEVMKHKKALIKIMDLSNQEILFDATDLNEELIIKGHCRTTGTSQTIKLKSGKGKESILIEDMSGDKILLDPNSNTPILLEDNVGNKIVFDKENGTIHIAGVKGTNEESLQKTITVNGKYTQTVAGDKQSDIAGNVKVTAGNDANFGSVGNAKISIGGILDIVVMNAPIGTTPKLTSINILLAPVGGMKIEACVGDMEVSTKAGDALLKTLLGTARLDGTSVKLGSSFASEPLVLGNLWVAMMDQLLDALVSHVHMTSMGPSSSPLNASVLSMIKGSIDAGTQLSTFVTTEKIRSL